MDDTTHAPKWRRPSRCASNGCVEVAIASNEFAMRDGKRPDGSPVLTYDVDEWRDFVADVKNGKFDVIEDD